MVDLDFHELAARFRGRPRTRFAPAPTGWLHLGHVLNARWVWETARALDGDVLLRIEDHDRERSRPKFEAGILDDLDWLGFAPDIFPTHMFRGGHCDGRQSDRDRVYGDAFESLRAGGLVYACACTRKDIAAAVGDGEELRYPGTCRDKRLPIAEGLGWRVRMEAGVERFDDARLGPQEQDPAALGGDLLVRDRRGNWTYQFCVTVDDWRQAIDLVIRGTDLLASTGRQIRLARLLGRDSPPVFVHHPLILKAPGQKLSKSDGDTGIRDLRARGVTPREVREMAHRAVA